MNTLHRVTLIMNPNDVLKILKDRRSIRSYEQTPVSQEAIDQILEAGQWCQSANNNQPWRFIIIRNRGLLHDLAELAPWGKFLERAPVGIAIVADERAAPNWFRQDTAMAVHQMCIMTSALGLGTCWIGTFDREKAKSLLQLKDGESVTTVLPIGYPFEGTIPTSSRKSLNDLVEYRE